MRRLRVDGVLLLDKPRGLTSNAALLRSGLDHWQATSE